MNAIIARTFLQTTRKPLSSKTGKTVRYSVCRQYLTPALQNIIHPRAIMQRSPSLLVPLQQSTHVLNEGEKDRVFSRREMRVFLRLNSGFQARGVARIIVDIKGDKARPGTPNIPREIPKLSSRKICRVRSVRIITILLTY